MIFFFHHRKRHSLELGILLDKNCVEVRGAIIIFLHVRFLLTELMNLSCVVVLND